MAILCLALDLKDLERRLGNIIVGYTRDKKPIRARELKADGAMTVLLKDALMPNLVQTLENNPVFIHGGPFANIAHGCNSVLATKTALKLADYVVTEAGFGADLGAEKFFDIKCRKAGLDAGRGRDRRHRARAQDARRRRQGRPQERERRRPSTKGCDNLKRHLENMRKFGVPAVVAINRFITDTDAEIAGSDEGGRERRRQGLRVHPLGRRRRRHRGSSPVTWSSSPKRARRTSSRSIPTTCRCATRSRPSPPRSTAPPTSPAMPPSRRAFKDLEAGGFGHLPVCMAKTQYSFSTDPNKRGAPTGHIVPVRELRLSAGAEFVVVITGEIMTMPGLPRVPAAESIRLNDDGQIEGLF